MEKEREGEGGRERGRERERGEREGGRETEREREKERKREGGREREREGERETEGDCQRLREAERHTGTKREREEDTQRQGIGEGKPVCSVLRVTLPISSSELLSPTQKMKKRRNRGRKEASRKGGKGTREEKVETYLHLIHRQLGRRVLLLLRNKRFEHVGCPAGGGSVGGGNMFRDLSCSGVFRVYLGCI